MERAKGIEPSYHVPPFPPTAPAQLPWFIVMGILCGGVSALHMKFLRAAKGHFNQFGARKRTAQCSGCQHAHGKAAGWLLVARSNACHFFRGYRGEMQAHRLKALTPVAKGRSRQFPRFNLALSMWAKYKGLPRLANAVESIATGDWKNHGRRIRPRHRQIWHSCPCCCGSQCVRLLDNHIGQRTRPRQTQ